MPHIYFTLSIIGIEVSVKKVPNPNALRHAMLVTCVALRHAMLVTCVVFLFCSLLEVGAYGR